MLLVRTSIRPVEGEPGSIHEVVTVDPSPEMTPQELVAKLTEVQEAAGVHAVSIEADKHVTVVLYEIDLTKWYLQQSGALPEFASILPED